jgi:hypothetical protein
MAIEHELSSEIAAALLTGKEREPSELNHLKETVFRVHSTLQQLTTSWARDGGVVIRSVASFCADGPAGLSRSD